MADLIPIGTWICATNMFWRKRVPSSKGKGKEHVVQWIRCLRPEASEYDWECSCTSFLMRPGYCKHIKVVIKSGERCGWNSELEPAMECNHNELGNPCCPECGGPVEASRVAV